MHTCTLFYQAWHKVVGIALKQLWQALEAGHASGKRPENDRFLEHFIRSNLCGLVNISASVGLAHQSTEDAVMTSEIDCTWSLELLAIFCRSQVSPGTMHTLYPVRMASTTSYPVS